MPNWPCGKPSGDDGAAMTRSSMGLIEEICGARAVSLKVLDVYSPRQNPMTVWRAPFPGALIGVVAVTGSRCSTHDPGARTYGRWSSPYARF